MLLITLINSKVSVDKSIPLLDPVKIHELAFVWRRVKLSLFINTHKISHRSINFKEIIIQLYGHTYTTTCGKFIFEVCLWL